MTEAQDASFLTPKGDKNVLSNHPNHYPTPLKPFQMHLFTMAPLLIARKNDHSYLQKFGIRQIDHFFEAIIAHVIGYFSGCTPPLTQILTTFHLNNFGAFNWAYLGLFGQFDTVNTFSL